MRKFKRTKAALRTGLTLAIAAGVAYGGTSLTVGHNQSQKFFLRSAAEFAITGTVVASTTSHTPALLYPGVERYVRYEVTNPFSVPITVTSMNIASVTPPKGCPVANLDVSGTAFTGSLFVGVGATGSVAEPISLAGGPGNQDACQSGTFSFTFAGAATYTDATSTVLTSGTDPSVHGASVTLTATVTAANQSIDTSSPAGTVQFFACATNACDAPTLLGSSALGAGTATFSTPGLGSGTDYFKASFSSSTSYFSASTSNVFAQTVNGADHPSVVSLRSMSEPTVLGSAVTYVALASGIGSPSTRVATGSITFKDFGAPIGACSDVSTSSGHARCTVSYQETSGSPHEITATYSGDTFYMPSTSTMLAEKVVRAVPRNAVTMANPVVLGGTLHFVATVSGLRSTRPTGNVRWRISTPAGVTACAPTSTLANGVTSCSIVATKIGRYSASETYTGDANYTATGSNTSDATVARAVPRGAVTVAMSSADRAIVRAIIVGGGVTPTGSLTWRISGTAGVKSCAVSTTKIIAGSASCTLELSKQGTYAVSASYSGDANYLPVTTNTETLP